MGKEASKVPVRKFRCESCKHEWDEPFGTGRRGIDMVCPSCGSRCLHRFDYGGFGFGNRPWGWRGGQRPPLTHRYESNATLTGVKGKSDGNGKTASLP